MKRILCKLLGHEWVGITSFSLSWEISKTEVKQDNKGLETKNMCWRCGDPMPNLTQ